MEQLIPPPESDAMNNNSFNRATPLLEAESASPSPFVFASPALGQEGGGTGSARQTPVGTTPSLQRRVSYSLDLPPTVPSGTPPVHPENHTPLNIGTVEHTLPRKSYGSHPVGEVDPIMCWRLQRALITLNFAVLVTGVGMIVAVHSGSCTEDDVYGTSDVVICTLGPIASMFSSGVLGFGVALACGGIFAAALPTAARLRVYVAMIVAVASGLLLSTVMMIGIRAPFAPFILLGVLLFLVEGGCGVMATKMLDT